MKHDQTKRRTTSATAPAGSGGARQAKVRARGAAGPDASLSLVDQMPPIPPLQQMRVGKSLPAGKAGTIKLAHRFGAALLLVRYRYHWTGLYRYTTVELLVEAAPVTRGHSPDETFVVRIDPSEPSMAKAVLEHGGRWSHAWKGWILSGRSVQALGLGRRVASRERGRSSRTKKKATADLSKRQR